MASGSFLEFGREQVADRETAIRPPALGYLEHLVLGWEVVESVGALHCPAEREIAREQHVGPVEADDQKAVCRPRADARNLRQRRFDLLVGHPCERLVAQASIAEALGERPQGGALACGHAARAKLQRVDCEQLPWRWQMAAEALLQAREDRSCRPDR